MTWVGLALNGEAGAGWPRIRIQLDPNCRLAEAGFSDCLGREDDDRARRQLGNGADRSVLTAVYWFVVGNDFEGRDRLVELANALATRSEGAE